MTFNPYSIGFWLTRRAELTPHRIAVDFEDRALTYASLNKRANQAASTLASLGVRRGDRVAMLSENCPEYLEVFFACAKIGAVLAPVSWRLSEEEMSWQIEDSDPKLLISQAQWGEAAAQIFRGDALIFGSNEGEVSNGSYEDALTAGSPGEPDDNNSFDDALMILYTSGTTGRPKGAVLTHGNFFWANLNMLVNAEVHHDDVSLVFLPMFHIGGWNVTTLTVFLKGGTVVLERQFVSDRVLDLISKKQITLLMGVPATYLFMSQQPNFEDADFSSVRLMIVGGAPMPEALLEKYSARGISIVQGYGLTELAPNALILPMEDASRKLGSAGKPYFFTDTRLAGDVGNLVTGPATGEVVAAGPVVMQGYWRRDDATAETIVDGWLHTGDIARVDEEGYFFIVDRAKDMIISGGENLYPAEIENAIYEISAVAEVGVIGVPHDQWGEAVHAIVVPKEGAALTADEITLHCRARLAKFKVPRSIDIREEPLPRTPAGKVKKQELRAPFWEGKEKQI